MATIETKVKGDLTHRCVKGRLTRDELLACLKTDYQVEPTALWLWDLSEATLELNHADLQAVIGLAVTSKAALSKTRTAVVAALDVNYGLMRMLETLINLESIPWDMHTFRTRKEAVDWLGVDVDLR